jgi:multidrug efflux pump
MVFLILAALYERLTLPLAIIMAVPFGVFGALLAVWLRGLSNDLYLQIGLITLVGLAAKNAILIVEFASQNHRNGMSLHDAAVEAARLRFRPIVMTSLACIFGVLPLAISTGAGSAARHSIGTGVIGGMIMATFLAVFFVPLFFRWTSALSRRAQAEKKA